MSKLLKLAETLGAASALARTGWMLRGVPHQLAESVAEHSFWAAVIALELSIIAREVGLEVSPERAVSIAVLHDLAETVMGDIAKVSGISDSVKEEAEKRAIGMLPLSRQARDLMIEFIGRNSIEARLAKVAEELATLLRARAYMRLGYDVSDIYMNMCRRVVSMLRDIDSRLLVLVDAELGGLLYGCSQSGSSDS